MIEVIVDNNLMERLKGKVIPAQLRPIATTSFGITTDIARLIDGPTIISIYPMGTRPEAPLPTDWMNIPGAKGCTGQNRCLVENHERMKESGIKIIGLSVQSAEDQAEFAKQNGIKYPLLSDPDAEIAKALDLPTFEVDSRKFYQRMNLLVVDNKIAGVIYPISDPIQGIKDAMTSILEITLGVEYR